MLITLLESLLTEGILSDFKVTDLFFCMCIVAGGLTLNKRLRTILESNENKFEVN